MNAEERKARFAEAKARSDVLLDPDACRAAIAAEKPAPVVHRDDGFLCDWDAGRPRSEPPPLPRRTLTDAEIKRMIAEARAVTTEEITALIDQRIEANAWRLDAAMEATGRALGVVREQLRKEFAAEVGSLRADLTVARAHGPQRDVIDLRTPRRA